MTDIVLIDLRSDITMCETLRQWRAYARMMPDHEIFIDGDVHALVARPRGCKA
jgi:hypothetical protein